MVHIGTRGPVHRLHNFRTYLLDTTVVHKALSSYCSSTLPHFKVTIGEWKIAERTAVTIETVGATLLYTGKVCSIYISAHKDGKPRWIIHNRVQAKHLKPALSKIRERIRILAELEELSTKSQEQGDPSDMDTTDGTWSTTSQSSEDVD